MIQIAGNWYMFVGSLLLYDGYPANMQLVVIKTTAGSSLTFPCLCLCGNWCILHMYIIVTTLSFSEFFHELMHLWITLSWPNVADMQIFCLAWMMIEIFGLYLNEHWALSHLKNQLRYYTFYVIIVVGWWLAIFWTWDVCCYLFAHIGCCLVLVSIF